jgi:hypothetical protein
MKISFEATEKGCNLFDMTTKLRLEVILYYCNMFDYCYQKVADKTGYKRTTIVMALKKANAYKMMDRSGNFKKKGLK